MAGSLFLMKLVAVPLLVSGVSYIQKRWGHYVAGALYGLPLVGGPISLFLAIEQGMPFAVQAAAYSAAGQAGFFAYSIAYLQISKRYGWHISNLISITLCLLVFALLASLHITMPEGAIIFLISLAAYILYLRQQPKRNNSPQRRIPYELPLRAGTALLVVLLITGAAQLLGPAFAGVISLFPITGVTLYSFTHATDGHNSLVEFARGAGLVYLGFLGFFVMVAAVGSAYGVTTTYIAATATTLLCGWLGHAVQCRWPVMFKTRPAQ